LFDLKGLHRSELWEVLRLEQTNTPAAVKAVKTTNLHTPYWAVDGDLDSPRPTTPSTFLKLFQSLEKELDLLSEAFVLLCKVIFSLPTCGIYSINRN
jgi:hypothetical protein